MTYPNTPYMHPLDRQKGAALIIGLVLLISLTIIGVGMLSTTSLEHRMAGNMTDQNLAFTAAEAAGRAISTRAATFNGDMDRICALIAVQPCITRGLPENWWDDAGEIWWAANGISAVNFMPAILGVSTQPRIVIEILPPNNPNMGADYARENVRHVRLTSRGTGASDNTEVVIQQTIIKF